MGSTGLGRMPVVGPALRWRAAKRRARQYAHSSIRSVRNTGFRSKETPGRGRSAPPRRGPTGAIASRFHWQRRVCQVAALIGVDESVRITFGLGDVTQRERKAAQRKVIAAGSNRGAFVLG